MKKLIIFFFIFFPFLLIAQDSLFLVDGRLIEAKVQEITPDLVKYKLFDFQQGPLYSIEHKDILKIRYQSGRVEWYTVPEEKVEPPETEETPPPLPVEKPAPTEIPPVIESKPPPAVPPERTFQPGIVLGLSAGINAATGLYNYQTSPEPPFLSVLAAPSVGLHLDWRISRGFSLQSMIGYRGKGDRIDMFDWVSSIDLSSSSGQFISSYLEADGYIQTYVGYGECSLLPVINLGDKLQIGAGGYAAVGMHGKEKSDYTVSTFLEGNLLEKETINGSRSIEFSDLIAAEDNASTRYFNRIDYGLIGYLGIRAQPFTIGWTIHYGLQSWEPESDLFGNSKKPNETYHLMGSLFLTYFLGNK